MTSGSGASNVSCANWTNQKKLLTKARVDMEKAIGLGCVATIPRRIRLLRFLRCAEPPNRKSDM